MTENAVTFNGLGHAYRNGEWVYRNYSAEVVKGSVFTILGPNGRGKTTLLKALLGLLRPTEGSVATSGRTAFVPQLFQVGFDYTALDVVLMGRARNIGLFSQPSHGDIQMARDALARFGLNNAAERPFNELSGGQRQLAVFARAIVAEAEILILDEPTSALDLGNQSLILHWMTRLAHEENLTVVFTTHHPDHALAVADSALLMLGERDYVCGAACDVISETNLRALYGVEMKRVEYEHDGRTLETLIPIYAPEKEQAASGYTELRA
jgi:iron complex transport system ATP-binding protein